MNNRLPMSLLLLAATLTLTRGQAQDTTPAPASTTQPPLAFASRTVQIAYNPAILPLSGGLVNSLLTSSSVGGQLTTEILGPTYTDARQVLQFVAVTQPQLSPERFADPAGARIAVLYGQVQAQSTASLALTQELLAKAMVRLQKALAAAGQQALAKHQQSLANAKTQADRSAKELAETQAEHDSLLKLTGGISIHELRNEISTLKRRLNPLTDYSASELDAARRLVESAKAELDRFKEQLKKAPQQDPEIESLEKELASATKTLANLTRKPTSDKTPSTEIATAQRLVAELNTRLRYQRENKARQKQTDQDRLSRLEQSLAQANTQYKEHQARQKAAQERLDQIEREHLLEKTGRLDDLRNKLNILVSAAKRSQDQYDALKNRAELCPLPELTEIGAASEK